MSHLYTCPATTVPIAPGSFLDLQSCAVAAGFRGLCLIQSQAQYLHPQSSATPTPIPIEGISSLQTWATQLAQWAEENRAFFEASPTGLPPPPPDLDNITPIMCGVPIPPQCPSSSCPLPIPPSVHGGLSRSTARGFPSSPKLGKFLAAKPNPYDSNKI